MRQHELAELRVLGLVHLHAGDHPGIRHHQAHQGWVSRNCERLEKDKCESGLKDFHRWIHLYGYYEASTVLVPGGATRALRPGSLRSRLRRRDPEQRRLDGDLFYYLDPVRVQAYDFAWMIGEQANRMQSQVRQDLRPDSVLVQ